MIEAILLLIGLYLLIKGADFLVSSATVLARHFGISELIIGLTVVSLGTSLAELVVTVFSSHAGYVGISVSNVIGSNIFNVFVIIAIIGYHTRYYVTDTLILERDSIWLMTSAVAFTVLSAFGAILPVYGIIFIAFYLVYIEILRKSKKEENIPRESVLKPRHLAVLAAGIVLLYFGGKVTVDNAAALARILGVSEWLIGSTIVAAGTSFPEAAASLIAVRRKKFEMSLGNIIGSNLFNTLMVIGVATGFHTILIDLAAYALHYFFMMLATVFIVLIAMRGTFHRKTALISILLYFAYILLTIRAG